MSNFVPINFNPRLILDLRASKRGDVPGVAAEQGTMGPRARDLRQIRIRGKRKELVASLTRLTISRSWHNLSILTVVIFTKKNSIMKMIMHTYIIYNIGKSLCK